MPSRVTRRFPIVCFFLSVGIWLGWSSPSFSESSSGGTASSRGSKTSKSTSAKSLDSLLKSKAESHWKKGLASVTSESLSDDEIVESLARFVNRETAAENLTMPLVRAMSLLAEAKQPQASEALAKILGSGDFRLVMAAADIASTTKDRGFLEPLMKLTNRREYAQRYGFRRCVIDAVAKYPDKMAVDFLVDRLEQSDGQLKYETAINLQKMTGQDFGGIAVDWRRWWQKSRDDFVFSSRVQASQPVSLKVAPKPIPWDEPRPSFYGMTIYAKRVVFVIDRSGSMNSAINGETRLARAQQELQRAIKALTESDYFNIVAFDDRMEVFQTKLVQATDLNKLDGIRFGYGLEPRGDTACYEPLKMGLDASNDLELMLFLSDGEPNAGALVDPQAIVVAIANHNLTQRTTINTLGIDARSVHEAFLKNLAEKNYGKLLLLR
jgi:von Willebrand factor type A domain